MSQGNNNLYDYSDMSYTTKDHSERRLWHISHTCIDYLLWELQCVKILHYCYRGEEQAIGVTHCPCFGFRRGSVCQHLAAVLAVRLLFPILAFRLRATLSDRRAPFLSTLWGSDWLTNALLVKFTFWCSLFSFARCVNQD